ncbi:hypothetical protein ACSBR2_016957 [Camellia fascicularis]
MNNNNNINVLFISWRTFHLSHHHLRPPPTSRHAVLAFLASVLLDFIELKFQGKNASSFEMHQKAIWVAIASLILYCFAYEAELRLSAYSRIIHRGMVVLGSTCVLCIVCSGFGKRVGSDSPPIPNGVELGLSENHRSSSERMAARNGSCREQERPTSTVLMSSEDAVELSEVLMSSKDAVKLSELLSMSVMLIGIGIIRYCLENKCVDQPFGPIEPD